MTDLNPRADRPHMPGYGIATDAPDTEKLSWSWAEQELTKSRNYWLCTSRPDGNPHAMPVWGVWLNGGVMFDTGPQSQNGRNLAVNRNVVIHLESGDNCVILEGTIEDEADPSILARFADAYETKYNFRPDVSKGCFVLRPKKAFTWQEQNFTTSATRWHFDAG